MRARAAVTAVFLLAAVAGLPPGLAQEPEGGRAIFIGGVNVRVVNVDVYVRDKKGQPVEGMSREEFELLEDGRPVDIRFFGETSPPPPPVASEAPPGSEAPPIVAAVADTGLPLHVLVYVDDLGTLPADRARVLPEVAKFLAGKVGSGFSVRLLTLDHRLETRSPWLTTAAAVNQAFAGLAAEPTATGIEVERGRRRALDDVRETYLLCKENPACNDPCDDGFPELQRVVETYAAQVRRRVEVQLASVAQAVSALAGVPGRKAILYVGDGVEQMPGIDLFQHLADLCPQHGSLPTEMGPRFDLTPQLVQLAAHAGANGVTLYALDSAGLRAASTADASQGDRRFVPSANVDALLKSNLQGALFALARETGGQAILDANHPLPALEGAARDFRHAYSLGFVPEHEADGRTHLLEVKVRRKGVDVRYRKSYRDKPLEERLADRLISALLLGVEDNPLGVSLAVGKPPANTAEGDDSNVSVEIRVPLSRVTLLADGEVMRGRLRLVLAVRDASGAMTPIREQQVEVEGPGATETGSEPSRAVERRLFEVGVRLAPGDHRVAVAVRDEQGGGESVLTLPVTVPQGAR